MIVMHDVCGNPHFDLRYLAPKVPVYIRSGIARHPLRSGIQVDIRDHEAHAGLTEEWEIHSQTFLLDFVASGEFSCTLKDHTRTVDVTGGFSSIHYLPGQTQSIVFRSDRHVRWLGILVDRYVMQDLVSDGANRVAGPFDRLLRLDGQAEPLCMISQSTPHMQAILHQLFNCPYEGEMARLFIESKALELLFLRLSEQVVEPKTHDNGMTASEKERIFHARHILLRSMDETPSLPELARRVGISETKLKREFKQVFGMPVFEYVREHRLRAAYEMLVSREWNVTEAAVQVGYSSLSHFSQAFRSRFGVSPSTVNQGKRH